MHRYDGRIRALAALLAALAGFVDAMAFLALGGFFVSFMSGNSTRLGVGLAQGSTTALAAFALIALFVVGVACGSLAGHLGGRHRRPVVLALVTGLLAAAAALGQAGPAWAAAVPMVLAMGTENAVFEKDGEVQIGLTYMTGTLVKLGQRLAAAVLGGPRWIWAPYLLHWAGLVGGGVLGALAYHRLGLPALWIASLVAAGASGLAMRTVEPAPDPLCPVGKKVSVWQQLLL